MTGDQAILARRRLTNKLIAAKDAARIKPFLDQNCQLIAGDGSLMSGREAILSAFAAQFSDPSFVNYVRTSDAVALDSAGDRGAESGSWTALWRNLGQETHMSGTYLACWRKSLGQWVIESELYIAL